MQEAVEILLQYCVVESETGGDRFGRQSGIDGIHHRCYLFVDRNGHILLADDVYLPALQGGDHVRQVGVTPDIRIGRIARDRYILYATHRHADAFAFQGLEDGRVVGCWSLVIGRWYTS